MSNSDSKGSVNSGHKAICTLVTLIHIILFIWVLISDLKCTDYLLTWFFGATLSGIELSTKYKDDPASVLTSGPGLLYLSINGLLCILSLYIIEIFDLAILIEGSKNDGIDQRTMGIIQASLSTFFIMRSSFLKLGHDSQVDLGLSSVMKKLLEIIDREVDRVRATKRSKEITNLFRGVPHKNTRHVFDFCLNIMQNMSANEAAEIQKKVEELDSVIGADDKSDQDLNGFQFAIGLALYNVVGIKVLESAVKDLKLNQHSPSDSTDNNHEKDEVSEKRIAIEILRSIVKVK